MFDMRLDFTAIFAIVMLLAGATVPVFMCANEPGAVFTLAVLRGCNDIASLHRRESVSRVDRSACRKVLIKTTKVLTAGLALAAGFMVLVTAKHLMEEDCLRNRDICEALGVFGGIFGAMAIVAGTLFANMDTLHPQ